MLKTVCPGKCVKNNQWQLVIVAAPSGGHKDRANDELNKTLKNKAGKADDERGLWKAPRTPGGLQATCLCGATRCPAWLQRSRRRGSTTCPRGKPERGTYRAAHPSLALSASGEGRQWALLHTVILESTLTGGFQGHPSRGLVVGPADVGRVTAETTAREDEAGAGRAPVTFSQCLWPALKARTAPSEWTGKGLSLYFQEERATDGTWLSCLCPAGTTKSRQSPHGSDRAERTEAAGLRGEASSCVTGGPARQGE